MALAYVRSDNGRTGSVLTAGHLAGLRMPRSRWT